jgi:hypothetical protein
MLIKAYGVRCDGCGCSGASGFATMGQARAYVRRIGWTRVPKTGDRPAWDRCGKCTKRASS